MTKIWPQVGNSVLHYMHAVVHVSVYNRQVQKPGAYTPVLRVRVMDALIYLYCVSVLYKTFASSFLLSIYQASRMRLST